MSKIVRNARFCTACGLPGSDDNPLSRRALHLSCAEARSAEVARQLAAHKGEHFDAWRSSMASSVGAALPEPLEP